jgi:hypothetical protein
MHRKYPLFRQQSLLLQPLFRDSASEYREIELMVVGR